MMTALVTRFNIMEPCGACQLAAAGGWEAAAPPVIRRCTDPADGLPTRPERDLSLGIAMRPV